MKRRRQPHSASCRHCPRVRLLGLDFQSWRHAHELTREAVDHGHAAERAEYDAAHRLPTFRDYLVAMTGSGWPMSGSAPQGQRWAS